MREMKYIVTQDENGKEEIFIFPKSQNHDCFAESVEGIRNQTWGNWERIFRRPISAGFTDGVKCYGHSETLGLKSRPEDTQLL